MQKAAIGIIITVCIFLCLGSGAHARDDKKDTSPWSKYGLSAGGMTNLSSSQVRLGAKGLALGVDLEEFLGLNVNASSFRVEGYWRFTQNRRHRLDLGWYSLRRQGSTTIGRPIEIGDLVLPIGTTVNTSFNIDVIKGKYSYSFFQDDRFDLAFSAGLYVLPIDFEVNATGFIAQGAEEASITAPLPLLGLRGDFAVTDNFFLLSSFELFYLEIGDYRGGIFDGSIGGEYKFSDHFGLGLSVQHFDIRVEASGNDFPGVDFIGRIGYTFQGLMAYIKLYF